MMLWRCLCFALEKLILILISRAVLKRHSFFQGWVWTIGSDGDKLCSGGWDSKVMLWYNTGEQISTYKWVLYNCNIFPEYNRLERFSRFQAIWNTWTHGPLWKPHRYESSNSMVSYIIAYQWNTFFYKVKLYRCDFRCGSAVLSSTINGNEILAGTFNKSLATVSFNHKRMIFICTSWCNPHINYINGTLHVYGLTQAVLTVGWLQWIVEIVLLTMPTAIAS